MILRKAFIFPEILRDFSRKFFIFRWFRREKSARPWYR